MSWRVGRKLGRTLYDGERLVGMMDTAELAAQVVAAVNAQEDVRRRVLEEAAERFRRLDEADPESKHYWRAAAEELEEMR